MVNVTIYSIHGSYGVEKGMSKTIETQASCSILSPSTPSQQPFPVSPARFSKCSSSFACEIAHSEPCEIAVVVPYQGS